MRVREEESKMERKEEKEEEVQGKLVMLEQGREEES